MHEKAMELRVKNLLHIQDVDQEYGEKRVLDDVDLSVAAGEFCTLVGPSGCGKSTLLRLILGQERPTRGEVLINGKPVGFPNKNRGIVYQKYSLFPHLSVLENALLGKRLICSPYTWAFRKNAFLDEAYEFLKKVQLHEHAHKYPDELSGGMRQRAAVIQALIMRPQILLMDEPFGALDPGTREDMQMFLLELWEEYKITIFFVTHDLEEAAFLGTRLLVLSQYYSDGRGEGSSVRRGARIVADYPLRRSCSTKEKYTSAFGELLEQVRKEGFDPAYLQHITEFNLRHPHSFQTIRDGEK